MPGICTCDLAEDATGCSLHVDVYDLVFSSQISLQTLPVTHNCQNKFTTMDF